MNRWTRLLVGLMVLGLCFSLADAALAARAPAKKEAAPAPAAAPAAPETPKPANLDEALKQLATYEFGQSREALTMISDAIRDSHANKADRDKLVGRLTGMLAGSTSIDGKRFICRQLSIGGGAASVPALAALLLDKDLSDMARYALERIEDPAAVAAMRAALPRAAGKQKIGIINSLGDRKDAESLAALAAALGDADPAIAAAAAAAVGKIDGSEAAKALTGALAGAKPEVRPTVVDALLLCADRLAAAAKKDEAAAIYQAMYKPTEAKHIRMAALRGLVAGGGDKALALVNEILAGSDADMQAAALRFLREVSGPESAKTVASLLPKCPVGSQALLLDDLAARGDPATLPAVLAMMKSPDANVRLSAIRAAGKLGDASALPLLMPLAAGAAGPEQIEARAALDRLPGANTNDALIQQAQAGDVKVRAEAVRALGARRVAAAGPALLKAAADADAGVRLAAVQALDQVADEKSAGALVGILAKAGADDERKAAEKAVASLCSRAANKDSCVDPILAAVGGAQGENKYALIRVLGRAGTPKALAAVRNFVKDADAKVQDAAIRSMADWTDASAAPDLLAIAKGAGTTTQKVLALRGYIRLAGGQDVQTAARLKMYQDAMAAAARPDEKIQVLGGLGDVKSPEALKMVVPCLDDAALAAPACIAAVKIGKTIAASAKNEVRDAMVKVLAVTQDNNVKKDAGEVLKSVGGAPKAPATKAAKAPRVTILRAPAAEPAPTFPQPKKVDLSPAEAIGWRLAVQAYTFRGVTFSETVDKAASIGIKYIEVYPGQKFSPDKPTVKTDHGMTDEQIAEMRKKAESAGVKIVNYGVVGLGKDEAANRRVFDFAKKVGLETIVSEPSADALPGIDKLCQEYGISVAFHNHPKPSPYWDPDIVVKACEGLSKRMGSDADTGHWMRSGLNPLDCLKKLRGRIISLHFKDLNKMGPAPKGEPGPKDVPWGAGVGNARGMLQEIYDQGFKGVFSIEYEDSSGDLLGNVAKCAEFFAATAAELSKGAKK